MTDRPDYDDPVPSDRPLDDPEGLPLDDDDEDDDPVEPGLDDSRYAPERFNGP